jgi:hypothetical protein
MPKTHHGRALSVGEAFSTLKTLLVLLSLVHASIASAQVKLSMAKMHLSYHHFDHSHAIRNFAPAIVLKGQRNFCHEVELASVNKYKAPDRRYFLFGLRYQFTKNFIRKPDPRIMPQLGLSMTQWYSSDNYYNEASYYRELLNRSFSFIIGFAPQVRAHIWRKWYMDLAVPVTVMGYAYGRQKLSHSFAQDPDQSISYSSHAFHNPVKQLKHLTLRLGFGIKL